MKKVTNEPTASERLIVALDTETPEQAQKLVEDLGEEVSFYKVGWIRLLDSGLAIVRGLKQLDKKVFVDLKSFDIEATVKSAVRLVRDMGADFVTIHGTKRTITAAKEVAGPDLKVLAVTILTSMSQQEAQDMYGFDGSVEDEVVSRTKRLLGFGCDGVIASAQEAKRLKADLEDDDFLLVTPGIRLESTSEDDHKRPGKPRQAIADGADYLVVGRPIYEALDPLAAAREYIAEIEKGLEDREDPNVTAFNAIREATRDDD